MSYLDHNATTPLDDEVEAAMQAAFPVFGNPSSSHSAGVAAKAEIEAARQHVANLISCSPSEIIFTSGGTESNNLAIIGTAFKHQNGHIITSAIEHPSVLNPVRWLEQRGFGVRYLPVDSLGRVSPGDVKKALRKDTVLITVMHSNNETGVIQPVREIGEIAGAYGIAFHSDAAQSVGKMEVDVKGLMVDMLTVVPHKFYGPKGAGALYIKDFSPNPKSHIPYPIMFGAGHEKGMRPGTENIICISGFGKACETAKRDMSLRYGHAIKMRDKLFHLLQKNLDIRLNGHETLRLPNTLNVSIKGIIGEDLVEKLKDKLAISSGSACHSGIRKPSAVLKAMGMSDEEALSSIRLSTGKDNSIGEMEEASEMIIRTVKELRS